ncbi:MAG: putative bifunctional diguanylate cyclase/phosphodiesterase [Woeseiaceae bacterium]
MGDSTQSKRPAETRDSLDLTRSIKRLSIPVDSDKFPLSEAALVRSAVLICRDSDAKKWGPRWLKQSGLKTTTLSTAGTAHDEAAAANPDVVIIEAGMTDRNGTPLFTLLKESPDINAPIIVLCTGSRDMFSALDADVHDVIRKPLEWQLVSHRARQAAECRANAANLESAQNSLAEAIQIADQARQQLRSRESFEPVTGLPNKTKFIDLLTRGMMAVDRDKNALAVLVVGFNRFRLVIEAMGQDRANLVLTEIGKIVNQCLQDAEMAQQHASGLRTAAAASIELAKFGLMFTCSESDDSVTHLQQLVAEKLSHPVQVAGQTVHLSACVGVALYPQDASDVDQLLQRADNAMRDAQSRGGGFRFYCEETDAAAARKLKLENMLYEALARDELSVCYQPISNTESGRITGAEALLRWHQADGTTISPEEFVPIAEDAGLMIRIGEFVLDQACRQLEAWQQSELPIEHMCINVSKAQLVGGGLVQTVANLLDTYSFDPGSLELELSERGVLSGRFDVIDQLHELKNLGVTLSIDDFGTGDSAIAYLRDLPVDSLKIDRSYVSGLTKNKKDAALIAAMIALAQKLDLKVIAEGVETRQQVDMLKNLGCSEFQGFFVSASIPAEEFSKLLMKSI